jgi:DNA repair protein NreA
MSDIKFEVIKKIAETNFKYRDFGKISKLDSSSPPSIFIGSKLRYPLVNVGIISPLERDENAWLYDDAEYWAQNNFGINDVINLRNSLLNSRFQSQVSDTRSNSSAGKKFVEIAQEIAIASKPVDVEIELKNKLNLDRKRDRVLMHQGMRGNLKQAKITSNVKVDRRVDKVINDEMKAVEGMQYLSKNNFSEYTLAKILSVGVLGLKKNKRLVPTRWSITATDDTLGKNLLKQVRDYKWIENYELFFGEFLGNCYLIMLFPNVWSYELFELYLPRSSWNPSDEIKASTDYENYFGRKTYASNTVGGYYASRLPIIRYLNDIKRQAGVLVIRIETPSYWAALGVWVVRESVKKALKKNMKFDSKEELMNSVKKIGQIKFNFDVQSILDKSLLLKQISTQRNLGMWM